MAKSLVSCFFLTHGVCNRTVSICLSVWPVVTLFRSAFQQTVHLCRIVTCMPCYCCCCDVHCWIIDNSVCVPVLLWGSEEADVVAVMRPHASISVAACWFWFQDYFEIVKKPMDLSLIKRKLDTGQYTEPWQYVDDVWLMFDNAWLYNRKSSKVHKNCSKVRHQSSSCIINTSD